MPVDFSTTIILLGAALYSGKDEDFQVFVFAFKKLAESECKSFPDFNYYKCLITIWEDRFDDALVLVEANASRSVKKQFRLPSASGRVVMIVPRIQKTQVSTS